ncbi:hypothetical protein HPP92_017489 [Vanilla planifolia]|uniref:Nodulin-like protein n=1 Tax=Vanilla planifolia TaxID=51239 RepID=A0A835UQM1_VANPL|nr:hypothetical protein HPP92_017489 [Vanilla planifolia]
MEPTLTSLCTHHSSSRFFPQPNSSSMTSSFASDAGKLFGWISGIAATHLPLRVVLLIGACFSLIGYGLQFLSLAQKISRLSYLQVFLLTSLAGNGICWINTVCYLTCIRNFSSFSRAAVGISTSYVGLSAKVYTALADVIFHPKEQNKAKAYLLLNAACPLLVAAVTAPMLREDVTFQEERADGAFLVMFALTLATGLCSLFGSIGSETSGFWSREHAISLGVLLFAPVFVMPIYTKLRERAQSKERRVHDVTIEEVEGEEGMAVVEVKGEGSEQGMVAKEDVNVCFKLLFIKLNFWLYFLSYMFGASLGIVFLNNLGQIAESRGVSGPTLLVSVASSFGFFGRLMPSLLDFFLSKRGVMVSRTGFIAAMMVPMVGAFFLLLNTSNLVLYISTAAIGACSGAITSIAISATAELFGEHHFAVNHNILITNIPIASFFFGYLAAVLYQREGGSVRCMGADCYSKTFFIWGCLCSLGTLLCTALYIRTLRSHSMVTKKEKDASDGRVNHSTC